MNESRPTMGRYLKTSAELVSMGLVVEMLTLSWSHPLTFFAWAGAGFLLVGSGIMLYLYALLKYR